MAPLDQQLAEHRFKALLEDSGLPLPDEVDYGRNCVPCLWLYRKVAVVIDIDKAGIQRLHPRRPVGLRAEQHAVM